jgi:hypothetical protein
LEAFYDLKVGAVGDEAFLALPADADACTKFVPHTCKIPTEVDRRWRGRGERELEEEGRLSTPRLVIV